MRYFGTPLAAPWLGNHEHVYTVVVRLVRSVSFYIYIFIYFFRKYLNRTGTAEPPFYPDPIGSYITLGCFALGVKGLPCEQRES